jgi:hypothetical protein
MKFGDYSSATTSLLTLSTSAMRAVGDSQWNTMRIGSKVARDPDLPE